LPGEGQLVTQRHRLQDGFEFVKAIRPAAEDVEQEVDFAAGQAGEGHAQKNAPAGRRVWG
jgi:hypothetical protein